MPPASTASTAPPASPNKPPPKASTAPPSVVAATSVKRAIGSAIQLGAPQYNQGDVAGCARTYEQTAGEIVRRCGDSATKQALQAVLQKTVGMRDADEVAWALRRVFDALLDRNLDPRLM